MLVLALAATMVPVAFGLATLGRWTIRRKRMQCARWFAWQDVRGRRWRYVPHQDDPMWPEHEKKIHTHAEIIAAHDRRHLPRASA